MADCSIACMDVQKSKIWRQKSPHCLSIFLSVRLQGTHHVPNFFLILNIKICNYLAYSREKNGCLIVRATRMTSIAVDTRGKHNFRFEIQTAWVVLTLEGQVGILQQLFRMATFYFLFLKVWACLTFSNLSPVWIYGLFLAHLEIATNSSKGAKQEVCFWAICK